VKNNKFIFIKPAHYPNPRDIKNINIAKDLGFEVEYWGAFREKKISNKEIWGGIKIKRYGIYYAYSSYWYFLGTPLFILRISIQLFKKRPLFVHASDIEAMLASISYKILFKKSKLLFNIHDNCFIRHEFNNFIKKILKLLECKLSHLANIVLLPEDGRLEIMEPWKPKNYLIIPNTPPDPGYFSIQPFPPIRILAAGWLMWTRGYKILGEIVKKRRDVEIIIAGRGSQEVINYILSLPRTKYYGYLSQDKVLKLGVKCHLIVAFYDPSIEINIYAAPNKVYDALALGRPIIINKETKISRKIKEWDCGYCIEYGNVEELNRLLNDIIKKPHRIIEKSKKCREIYEKYFRWKTQKRKIIKIIEEMK